MGLFKNNRVVNKIVANRDKKVDARLARKDSRVESKNRARETKANLKYAPKVEAAAAEIDKTAQTIEQTPEDVSLQILENPTTQQQLKGYLGRKGITPASNPKTVAIQTYEAYRDDVLSRQEQDMQDAQNSGNMEAGEVTYEDYPLEEYEDEVLEEEFLGRERSNFDGSDPDNFLSAAAVAAIGKGAPVLIDAVNAKRAKEGKKPIPTIDQIINGTSDPNAQGGAIGKSITAAQEEYIAQKKKEEIKKMMPAIVIGILLLIGITAAVVVYSQD